MSPATQNVVKWPLLFILFTLVVACTGKQQPTGQESSITTDQKPSTSPKKTIESPGAHALDVASKLLGTPVKKGLTFLRLEGLKETISVRRDRLLAALGSGLKTEEMDARASKTHWASVRDVLPLSLIHISEPTRPAPLSRMPSSA